MLRIPLPEYDGFALCNYRAEGSNPSAPFKRIAHNYIISLHTLTHQQNVAGTMNRFCIDEPKYVMKHSCNY